EEARQNGNVAPTGALLQSFQTAGLLHGADVRNGPDSVSGRADAIDDRDSFGTDGLLLRTTAHRNTALEHCLQAHQHVFVQSGTRTVAGIAGSLITLRSLKPRTSGGLDSGDRSNTGACSIP